MDDLTVVMLQRFVINWQTISQMPSLLNSNEKITPLVEKEKFILPYLFPIMGVLVAICQKYSRWELWFPLTCCLIFASRMFPFLLVFSTVAWLDQSRREHLFRDFKTSVKCGIVWDHSISSNVIASWPIKHTLTDQASSLKTKLTWVVIDNVL